MYYMPYGDDDAAENEAEYGDPDGDAIFMHPSEFTLSPEEDSPSSGFAGAVSGYILLMILAALLAIIL